MQPYTPAEIEAAAQAAWRAADVYRAQEVEGARKFYCVSMLPYPSGKLHMGHVRNYTINDVMYRYLRMNGWNVLMPMGWDAFGLPAENAAMKNGVPPARWTYDNIATMKGQMQAMGLAIDWSREVASCDPAYYRWNQWFFLRMLEKGIAYKKTGVVNWDPGRPDGARERAGHRRPRLALGRARREARDPDVLPAHHRLRRGAPRVSRQDARLARAREDDAGQLDRQERGRALRVPARHPRRARRQRRSATAACTCSPRAPTRSWASRSARSRRSIRSRRTRRARNPALAAFIDECKRGSVMEADIATMEKKGMPTGLTVTHPLTGEQVAVWVGNYVLMGYGDGAVMGVPAHDERDFAFALKYGLPIRQVIAVEGETFSDKAWQPWYADKLRGACVHSGKYDGLAYEAAVDAVAADLGAKGLGEKKVTFRLRDWGISRQRYWGTPIPIIHCDACGDVPVPEKDLPVILPEDCVPDGSGNPLNKREDFLAVDCPKCGAKARRETDTMDTFVDSSWYYMRYTCPDAPAMVDGRNDYWMPMDQYIGGIEHAILHLLYARFWTKVMRDLGLVKIDEPFTRLLTQGMVLNHIYSRRGASGGIDYFWPQDVENVYGDDGRIVGAKLKADGSAVDYDGVGTMSKSKNNGVDPQELIDKYGADTARHFVMSAAPPEATMEWSDAGVEGSYRFLRRLWTFAAARADAVRSAGDAVASLDDALRTIRRELHLTLKQANYDYERVQYNTVVSAGYKMLNALETVPMDAPGAAPLVREGLSILLRVLYPVTPHIACALWEELGFAGSIGSLLDAAWPNVDAAALVQQQIELVLQVNGKLRGKVVVPADADRAAIEAAARASAEVAKHAAGAPIKKVVIVPGRLVNVVV